MTHRLIDAYPSSPFEPDGMSKQMAPAVGASMVDGFKRTIKYLRLSVTDRCDLRCTYCMPERMTFLPKSDLLDFDELTELVNAFVDRGVNKLRVTGGEPLVRRDVLKLLTRFSKRLGNGLNELTLTTNGTELERFAQPLADIGVKRINVSLDTLDKEKFTSLVRRDALEKVLQGLAAAKAAGLKVKINTVAQADVNAAEISDLISWAHDQGFDLSLIEIMPMGNEVYGRSASFLSLDDVKKDLASRWSLSPDSYATGGPSRYVKVKETGGRVGFITPLSHNFCSDCNRVRVTATGRLYTCLGQEDGADLRAALREHDTLDAFHQILDQAIAKKPERHAFSEAELDTPASPRTMSVTGG